MKRVAPFRAMSLWAQRMHARLGHRGLRHGQGREAIEAAHEQDHEKRKVQHRHA